MQHDQNEIRDHILLLDSSETSSYEMWVYFKIFSIRNNIKFALHPKQSKLDRKLKIEFACIMSSESTQANQNCVRGTSDFENDLLKLLCKILLQ